MAEFAEKKRKNLAQYRSDVPEQNACLGEKGQRIRKERLIVRLLFIRNGDFALCCDESVDFRKVILERV